MEVRNRFKGLDMIDRMPDELWMEVCDIVQETGIKTIPKKKKCKKVKWLSGGLKNSCEKKISEKQRRSPRKMVGGANLHLESNPIPSRDAQRAQTNLVCTRTQGPHRDRDRTVFEHLLWGYGSAVA